MNKKGSMELSVNSIVILVIAIVMLGLILGFVKSKFSQVGNGLTTQEPEPSVASASTPITLSRTTIETSAGQTFALKVGYYDGGIANFTGNPSTSCTTLTFDGTSTFNSKTVGVGQSTTYTGLFKVASTVPKGTYLCQMLVNSVSYDYTIQID